MSNPMQPNPFASWYTHGFPPHPPPPPPPSIPSMHHAQLLQSGRSIVQAPVRLAADASKPAETSSDFILKCTTKQSHALGEELSVGGWACSFVIDNASCWLLRIAKRVDIIRNKGKGAVIVAFGDGYDCLLLIQGATIPKDLEKVPRLGVGVAILSTPHEDDSTRVAEHGLNSATDGIWDHLSAALEAAESPNQIRIYLHTDIVPPSAGGPPARRKVFQVWASPDDPYAASRVDRLLDVEESLNGRPTDARHYRKQKTSQPEAASAMVPPPAAMAIGAPPPPPVQKPSVIAEHHQPPSLVVPAKIPTPAEPAKETGLTHATPPKTSVTKAKKSNTVDSLHKATVAPASLPATEAAAPKSAGKPKMAKNSAISPTVPLNFNPKEVILLEKAFEEKLNKSDLKADASKFSKEDVDEAVRVMKRVDQDMQNLRDETNHVVKEPTRPLNGTKRGRPVGSKRKAKEDPAKIPTETPVVVADNAPVPEAKAPVTEVAASKAPSDAPTEPPAKKRGRPRGSKTKKSSSDTKSEPPSSQDTKSVPPTPSNEASTKPRTSTTEEKTIAAVTKKRSRSTTTSGKKEEGGDAAQASGTPVKKRKGRPKEVII